MKQFASDIELRMPDPCEPVARTFPGVPSAPNLHAILSTAVGGPVLFDVDDISSGRDEILVNQDGVSAGPVKVKATQRIRPDCVYMVHGFGHSDKRMRRSLGKGADDNALITRVKIDPIMGGTGMRVNFVTIEPAEALAMSDSAE